MSLHLVDDEVPQSPADEEEGQEASKVGARELSGDEEEGLGHVTGEGAGHVDGRPGDAPHIQIPQELQVQLQDSLLFVLTSLVTICLVIPNLLPTMSY